MLLCHISYHQEQTTDSLSTCKAGCITFLNRCIFHGGVNRKAAVVLHLPSIDTVPWLLFLSVWPNLHQMTQTLCSPSEFFLSYRLDSPLLSVYTGRLLRQRNAVLHQTRSARSEV